MIMVSNNIKIGVMTNHLPLRQVPATVSEDLIIRKLKIFNSSLQRDFGIRMPKIAVLALNPHAGDSGVNGEEDDKIVSPAIKKAYEKENILAFGPFPADGFFGSGNFKNYDGVLSLYHDQGLIAFKLLSFESGVNFTAGLNYIRTSPAHGVAYHLAGTNTASCDSFRHALYLAIDIYKNRKLFEEISANPMQVFDKTNFKETDISKDLQKDEVRDFL
jgi:4-hydroxythreonine-4-phosphate dehydrogenase